jgi:hypothetical protein
MCARRAEEVIGQDPELVGDGEGERLMFGRGGVVVVLDVGCGGGGGVVDQVDVWAVD